VAVVLVAVGIVVVVALKSGNNDQAGGGGKSAAPGASSAIDPCLVGNWTVTKASMDWTVDGVGSVVLDSQNALQTVVIRADGTADDNYGGDSKYSGTSGGHTYTLDVSGKVHYSVRTANDTLTFVDPQATGVVTYGIDGKDATSFPLSVSSDPTHYTCGGSTLTEHTETYDATLTKS
jgi:hypothetical protein